MHTDKVVFDPKKRSIAGGGLSLNKKEPGSLHNTTREALICFRVMGFLPLTGLTNRSSDKVRYTLRSPYTIYYAFSIFGQILMCLATIFQIYQKRVQLGNFTNFIFCVSNLAAALILAKTSYSWPTIMKTFEKIENQLPYFRRSFRTTVTLATAFMITISAGKTFN
ncbi:unnamed protein product [Arctia plantaginis]|uniref:Gustatory receptor n=1 Tax=Arctia plantaginis TaxID=874455 RepID=A0A8S0YN60_ARCPL|nr:unnamed protein product [Arctia plantaginis]